MSQVEENKLSILERAKEKVLSLTSVDNDDSKTKLVRQMKVEIRKARKAGRSWKEIAAAMSEVGLNVSRTILATECGAKVRSKKEKANVYKQPVTAPKMQMSAKTAESMGQVDVGQSERRRPTIRPDHDEL